MKAKYIAVSVLAITLIGIGIASAHITGETQTFENTMLYGDGFHMGMDWNNEQYENHIDWMQNHMNITKEDIEEMTEHCPMMRRFR